MNRNEVPAAALIFLFGAVTAGLSMRMPIGDFRAPGSGLFPLCMGILLVLLSTVHGLEAYFKTGGGREGKSHFPAAGGHRAKQVILFMGSIAAAMILFSPLGYPAASFLLMTALLKVMHAKKWDLKNWGMNLLLAFAAASASYLLFVRLLKIPLPKGWLWL